MRSVNKLLAPRPACPAPSRAARACAALARATLAWALPGVVGAEPPARPALTQPAGPLASLPEALAADISRLVADAAALVFADDGPAPRIEVQVGRADARLRLAACSQVTPYLPADARPLGRTRIGLRCTRGAVAWNISLPLTVKVFAPALVTTTALPSGTVLAASHLKTGEVDLAERADPALRQPQLAVGRTLAHGLAAGDAVRRDDLKLRQWFSAGDTVRILALGAGYAISSEGQALGPGLDGQAARVRTEGGRIITGTAAGERRVEIAL